MKATNFRRLINLWPPFFFAGIRAKRISDDYREVDATLKLHWYNRNYVGSHFGGNLFSMTDPWFMLMLMQILGREYLVWDRAATIEFVAPGRGTVTARFRLTAEQIAEVIEQTRNGDKYLPTFHADIVDAQGQLVCKVTKTVYVRRKPAHRPQAEA
jgi:acyl-coenzyme A thioesterase PaaI-like protein